MVPALARQATINVNGIEGGQPIDGVQTPCVADRCRAVFDRRFLIANVPHCVACGPGQLELAHQADESCRIDDLVNATKVLALATLDLMDGGR